MRNINKKRISSSHHHSHSANSIDHNSSDFFEKLHHMLGLEVLLLLLSMFYLFINIINILLWFSKLQITLLASLSKGAINIARNNGWWWLGCYCCHLFLCCCCLLMIMTTIMGMKMMCCFVVSFLLYLIWVDINIVILQ